MAAIKVHGSPFSTASQRVFATLYEKDVDFEFVNVDMRTGEHKKEPFLSLNPFGQVPAYQEGDLTLFAAVEANEAKLTKVLDVYEARLSKSKYLGGDQFTLVDLHHLPNLQCLIGTPTKKLLDSRPKVSAWIADITGRPAWAKVLAMQKH
ncbi:unnamed protein product [Linum tenue]|uniref:glutathione transferase n=1 Tax=Linum tenue TaxID=586396 RepID=A0AAV0IBQ8_9ROSI|nr:unnamed protein product [Linum tenue]